MKILEAKLDAEIIEFTKQVELQTDKIIREKIIYQVRQCASEINSEIDIYGSYPVSLSLPYSSLDLLILNNSSIETIKILEHLWARIKRRPWAISQNTVTSTTMPVMKVDCNFDSKSLKLIITVNNKRHTGPYCMKETKSFLEQSSSLKPLILLVKHIMKLADLNDSYTGGLSSYGQLIMIMAFFQYRVETVSKYSQGQLFLNFLQYYANFNFLETEISLVLEGSSKKAFFEKKESRGLPVIIDPFVSHIYNNVAKSSHKFQRINMLFRQIIESLSLDCNCPYHKMPSHPNNIMSHSLLFSIFSIAQSYSKEHIIPHKPSY